MTNLQRHAGDRCRKPGHWTSRARKTSPGTAAHHEPRTFGIHRRRRHLASAFLMLSKVWNCIICGAHCLMIRFFQCQIVSTCSLCPGRWCRIGSFGSNLLQSKHEALPPFLGMMDQHGSAWISSLDQHGARPRGELSPATLQGRWRDDLERLDESAKAWFDRVWYGNIWLMEWNLIDFLWNISLQHLVVPSIIEN